ncbi:MAG: DUF3857 domain-containing protein [Bacteroidaceae bacterium]|nr:DUF3857 domain-containing protein [Bacteroidaceae bacterium]
MRTGISLMTLLLTGSLCAHAQKKFAKVDVADFKTTVCAIDSSAAAEYIYRIGETEYYYAEGHFYIKTELKTRIRVLKDDGKDAANVAIRYYYNSKRPVTENDRIQNLSATAYNLVDGKVVKTSMPSKYVFKETVNENSERMKFSIPDVKVGTIIEYKYTHISEGYHNIDTWYSQQEYPVQYSFYTVTIPQYFKFHIEEKGFQHSNTTRKPVDMVFNVQGNVLKTTGERVTTEAENLKAIKDEGFVWCPKTYSHNLSFELYGIDIPGAVYKDYTSSWNSVRKTLAEEGGYRKCLSLKNPYSEEMKQLGLDGMSATKKASVLFGFIQKKLKWNGDYKLVADNPNKAVKNGKGSNAELNFIYMSMLREAGITCTPLLLCLRDRGRLPVTYPSIDKLHTFVVAFSDEKGALFFADCSAEYGDVNVLPLNLLAEGVLYETGITSIDSQVFDLAAIRGHAAKTVIRCGINPEGDLVGTKNNTCTGILAEMFKKQYHETEDSLALIEKIEKWGDCKLQSYNVKNVEGTGLSSTEQYRFTKSLGKSGDRLYVNPMVFADERNNYFVNPTRDMPIEFSNLQNTEIKSSILIPEDYEIEEIPAGKLLTFKDGELEAKIDIKQQGRLITTVYDFNVNNSFILAADYAELQKFWTELLDINSLKIVLKKKA